MLLNFDILNSIVSNSLLFGTQIIFSWIRIMLFSLLLLAMSNLFLFHQRVQDRRAHLCLASFHSKQGSTLTFDITCHYGKYALKFTFHSKNFLSKIEGSIFFTCHNDKETLRATLFEIHVQSFIFFL